ncbi:MAG: diaminopimelate epimerase [Gemmatimonadetes bacterium]|nr:diaminopimelate epimerase [Gemmatimonadota bacterium]
MEIWKGEALGNDYLIVERAALPWPLTPARCRAICDRHTGIGSDGILIAATSARAFALQILNPDGSEAEKSGNGLRILAAWLHGRGLVRDEWFTVELVKDRVRMRVEGARPDGALEVRVEMGTASFVGGDVGFHADDVEPQDEVLDRPLSLPGGATASIHTVSLANPHCVVFVDRLDRDDFLARAPLLCTHAAFAAGTNVQFARVQPPDAIEILIWERGVGETLASGSSACAATAVSVRRGLLRAGRIEVRMPGGAAEVEVSESYTTRLRGPARIVFRASVTPETTAAWGRLA